MAHYFMVSIKSHLYFSVIRFCMNHAQCCMVGGFEVLFEAAFTWREAVGKPLEHLQTGP